ncbi:MAG: methyltransferase domain-containing protein [Chthoniobacterales bacterium]
MHAESRFLEFERADRCPGCDGADLQTAFPPDIAQCKCCDLLFRNPRPTQAEIARSYNTGGTFVAWQEEESDRAAMWERRAAIIKRFQPSGHLLDVGTGDGRFLQLCRPLGYQVTGTELSSTGAAYAQRMGFNVHMGQILELDLPEQGFDLVTIWHVLEHVPDPGAVLRRVFTLLKGGGIFVLAVPNEENFFARRALHLPMTQNPFGPLPFGGEIHLTYFRPRTLLRTLRNAGFEILEFGVDDLYSVRDAKMKTKLAFQRTLARLFQWHFGVAMYAVCRRHQ